MERKKYLILGLLFLFAVIFYKKPKIKFIDRRPQGYFENQLNFLFDEEVREKKVKSTCPSSVKCNKALENETIID